MIDIKLKTCPFCGGEVQHGAYVAYSLDSSFDAIECENCEFYFNTERMSENEAAIEFNKRPIEGALTEENAQLKNQLHDLFEHVTGVSVSEYKLEQMPYLADYLIGQAEADNSCIDKLKADKAELIAFVESLQLDVPNEIKLEELLLKVGGANK